MPHSLSKIILHIVFSTKRRQKIIAPEFEKELHAYIAGTIRNLAGNAYRVGGYSDHIHIACTLPRTISVSTLVQEIKSSSSKWTKLQGSRCASFSWQVGYGVFSLGQAQLPSLINYIDGQKEHHRTKPYQEEVREFLSRYELEYDARFLWD